MSSCACRNASTIAASSCAKTVRKSSFQDVQGFKDYSDGKTNTISGIKIDTANPKKVAVTMMKVSCPAIYDLGGATADELADLDGLRAAVGTAARPRATRRFLQA